jgi:hypothetical protein
MKRVLIIAYAYPPRPSAGSPRPGGLAKYLPEFGWEPMVLTPELPVGKRPAARVIETGDRDILSELKRKLGMDGNRGLHEQFNLQISSTPRSDLLHTKVIGKVKSLLTYPDPTKGWVPFAKQALNEFAKRERVDAVISTSPPISSHLIAREAKKLFPRCVWVADFRDLWTQNLAARQTPLLGFLERRLERKTLSAADALVTVSRTWAERLRSRHPQKSVYYVANGFDPDDFMQSDAGVTKSFSITYTGQLYQGKRDPSMLFDVLQGLISAGILSRSDVAVHFYGPMEPWLPALIARYGLTDIAHIHGSIARDEALRIQSESQVLLLLAWSDPRETGQHTGKVFEYMGARRPILAVGGVPGALTELLEETQTGIHATSKSQLREFLVAAYGDFKRDGRVAYTGNKQAIARYTHREMASKFASVLDSLREKGVTQTLKQSWANDTDSESVDTQVRNHPSSTVARLSS